MKKYILFFCLFSIGILCKAQEKDSLLEEFNELRIQFRDINIGYEKIKSLSNEYLEKAKKSGQKRYIGRGYYLLAIKNPELEEKLQYIDSAIYYTKDLKGDVRFPMHAYLAKGKIVYYKKNYPETLTNYLLAESAATENGDLPYQYDIKYNIAFLKRISGNYREAEKLFKECIVFEESKKSMYIKGYLHTLLQLSSIYYESRQIVKSTEINKKGIQLSLANNFKNEYYAFVVNEGANLCMKGDYLASIDSLQKGISYLPVNDQAVAELYLAKSYYALGKSKKALDYFKKIDTILKENKNIFPPLRESYVYLIKDAKERKDEAQELYYITQLLNIDSIIHADYRYLSQTISKNYDIPTYVTSKERLIEKLEAQNKQISQERNWIAIIGAFIGLLSIILFMYYYRLKKKYKKRYNEVIQQSNSIVEEEIIVKNVKSQAVYLGIDQNIIEKVLKNLEIFEQGEAYLTNQISLKDVSKIVNTNSKYLSKIINSYKGKNFATYINDLRIDYLVNHVQHDVKYQKYTIRAIAEEIGFSNPEGFSKTFQKKIGLKPSYFIKKVIKDAQKKP